MLPPFSILPTALLDAYRAALPPGLQAAFEALPSEVPVTPDAFDFYTSVSAVYSSKIEGEEIDIDSYLRHRFHQGRYAADYTRKIDDLFEAYAVARTRELTLPNVLEAHGILTRHFLSPGNRGRLRDNVMYIIDREGRIEYVAADPREVETETHRLFADVAALLAHPISLEETLYAASMVHVVFLKIHPLADGNGRTARLLEKWFLAQKLGEKAWGIPSERFYYEHLHDYYRNVHIGVEYESVDYDRALPLLCMLPSALVSR